MKDDARRLLLRLVEHVANARRADADEHLDEIRAGDGEKRHLRLAGDRFRQQRLAGTRRPDHQHALGNLAAEPLELARVLEELDDFRHLVLGLVDAGNVGKRDTDLVLAEQSRLALAERHRAAAATAALHLAHEVDPDTDQQQDRKRTDQQLANQALRLRLGAGKLDTVLVEQADQRIVVGLRADRVELQRLAFAEANLILVDYGNRDLAGTNLRQETPSSLSSAAARH